MNVHSVEGTGLFCTWHASYSELVSSFGEPHGNVDDGKQRVCWEVDTVHGVVTIYDWKCFDTALEDVTSWNVGAHNQESVAVALSRL